MKKIKNELNREPVYFYRVSEFTLVLEDSGDRTVISNATEFKNDNLLQCKTNAEQYYSQRLNDITERGKYFLPFTEDDEESGDNYVDFIISVSLIEYYSDDEELNYCLSGKDEAWLAQNKKVESQILKLNRYSDVAAS